MFHDNVLNRVFMPEACLRVGYASQLKKKNEKAGSPFILALDPLYPLRKVNF